MPDTQDKWPVNNRPLANDNVPAQYLLLPATMYYINHLIIVANSSDK
ncbi:MAG: hypothetical protein ABIN36_00895 [Ferruginibacter sp.]